MRSSRLVQHTGQIALLHPLQDLVAGLVPDGLIEDLDLDESGIPGVLDERADPVDVDAAVSHHGPAQEHVGRRAQPVADVKTTDAPARACRPRWPRARPR